MRLKWHKKNNLSKNTSQPRMTEFQKKIETCGSEKTDPEGPDILSNSLLPLFVDESFVRHLLMLIIEFDNEIDTNI